MTETLSRNEQAALHDRVAWPLNFRERVGTVQGHLRAAGRSREGAGQKYRQGNGADLVGYRPYRPGEDLRQLDWSLLARLNKPYVRVTREEAGEQWVICVDASASMGVGPPGKLQRAAECAVTLWALACHQRAQVRLVLSGGKDAAPRILESASPRDLQMPMGFLGDARAAGASGLASLFENPRLFHGAARIFVIGDLLDEPAEGLLRLRRGPGELRVLQLLATHELHPTPGNTVWVDPESGQHLKLSPGPEECQRYRELLDEHLETWRLLAGKHRFLHMASSSETSFEDLMGQWLRS